MRVLGNCSVSVAAGGLLHISRSCWALLGYLIAHRRRHISRKELSETLWSGHDSDHARQCLCTALWRLKKSVSSGPPLLVFHRSGEVSLNWDGSVWIDSVALELRLQPLLRIRADALTQEDAGRLQRGVRLYEGEYLSEIDGEWASRERQRLRNLYCDGLYHLIEAHAAASNWAAVLDWGRRLNHEEPLREDVHRLLMCAYAHTGNRAKAVAQYRQCEHVLCSELSVEPMNETKELYRQLKESSARSRSTELHDSERAVVQVRRP